MQNKNLMSRKNDSQNLSMFFLVFFFFCISQLQFGRAFTATFGGWTDYYNICVIALEDKFKPLESAWVSVFSGLRGNVHTMDYEFVPRPYKSVIMAKKSCYNDLLIYVILGKEAEDRRRQGNGQIWVLIF